VTVDPHSFHGRGIAADGAPPSVEVVGEQGFVLHSLPVSAPFPINRKRALWNVLLGNPLGYVMARRIRAPSYTPSFGEMERRTIKEITASVAQRLGYANVSDDRSIFRLSLER
jgi:hypothetical protein